MSRGETCFVARVLLHYIVAFSKFQNSLGDMVALMWNYAHGGAEMIEDGDMKYMMEPAEDHPLQFQQLLGPKQQQRIRLCGDTSLGF